MFRQRGRFNVRPLPSQHHAVGELGEISQYSLQVVPAALSPPLAADGFAEPNYGPGVQAEIAAQAEDACPQTVDFPLTGSAAAEWLSPHSLVYAGSFLATHLVGVGPPQPTERTGLDHLAGARGR